MGEDVGLAGSQQYRIRDHAVDWLDVDEQVVALDAEKSVYLSTNPSGAMLWHHLVDGASVDGLTDELVAAYGIDRDRAEADVTEFLKMLDTHGLLDSH